jgi:hypothetical protein
VLLSQAGYNASVETLPCGTRTFRFGEEDLRIMKTALSSSGDVCPRKRNDVVSRGRRWRGMDRETGNTDIGMPTRIELGLSQQRLILPRDKAGNSAQVVSKTGDSSVAAASILRLFPNREKISVPGSQNFLRSIWLTAHESKCCRLVMFLQGPWLARA